VLKEAHDGICGAHQPGPKLKDRLHRLSYYWPTMILMQLNMHKGVKLVKSTQTSYINLRATSPNYCFIAIRVMGNRYHRTYQPLINERSSVHLRITDYFSKAEAIPLIEVKTSNIVNFIKCHIIHRFGVPRQIIHDNGPQFASQVFYQFCNKYQIQNVVSTAYNPATNGLAEAFNKTINKLLKKFVSSSKRDWNEKLGVCLWAYGTTV